MASRDINTMPPRIGTSCSTHSECNAALQPEMPAKPIGAGRLAASPKGDDPAWHVCRYSLFMLGFSDPHETRMSLPCLMDHTDLPHQLAHVPLFKGVEPEPLGRIIALARVRQRGSGEFFFNEGDAASEFFVLTSGRVKLTQVTPAGHQVVFGLIGPGDAFGGVGAFGDPNYPVSAETVETSAAMTWAAVTMQNVFETHTDVALNALRFVTDRLCDLQHRYREVMTERVERRVARALLRLVRDAGRRVDVGVEIDFPISRQDIAEMTGTTLYTVSRLMSAWENRGILHGGRQRIVLMQAHRLVAIAEDLPTLS